MLATLTLNPGNASQWECANMYERDKDRGVKRE